MEADANVSSHHFASYCLDFSERRSTPENPTITVTSTLLRVVFGAQYKLTQSQTFVSRKVHIITSEPGLKGIRKDAKVSLDLLGPC